MLVQMCLGDSLMASQCYKRDVDENEDSWHPSGHLRSAPRSEKDIATKINLSDEFDRLAWGGYKRFFTWSSVQLAAIGKRAFEATLI